MPQGAAVSNDCSLAGRQDSGAIARLQGRNEGHPGGGENSRLQFLKEGMQLSSHMISKAFLQAVVHKMDSLGPNPGSSSKYVFPDLAPFNLN